MLHLVIREPLSMNSIHKLIFASLLTTIFIFKLSEALRLRPLITSSTPAAPPSSTLDPMTPILEVQTRPWHLRQTLRNAAPFALRRATWPFVLGQILWIVIALIITLPLHKLARFGEQQVAWVSFDEFLLALNKCSFCSSRNPAWGWRLPSAM